MKIKQIPEDFVVDEIFNLGDFENGEEDKDYYYFKFTKTNYSQIRALQKVAKIFNTSKKLVHFAGTKDKVGVTSQLISVYGIKEGNFEKNLEFFNSNVKDMHLDFLGKFRRRINLGDNKGNSFRIVARDLSEKDTRNFNKISGQFEQVSNSLQRFDGNIEKVKRRGCLNYFDSQRFGYANNSHIVGKYVLLNDLEGAVREIMTSVPNEPSENLRRFAEFVDNNWDSIKNADAEVIDEAKALAPKFLEMEVRMLGFLRKYRNDFAGAFRILHKKQRTLYVNAYQSYVFNKILDELSSDELEDMKEIEYVWSEAKFEGKVSNIAQRILKEDGLNLSNFDLPSMPELRPEGGFREVWVKVDNLEVVERGEDELNEGMKKIVVSFDLPSGAYATNVVKQLFE